MVAGAEDTDTPNPPCSKRYGSHNEGWDMPESQPMKRQQEEPACGSGRRVGVTTPLRVLGGARAAVQTVAHGAMVQVNEVAMLMSVAAKTPLRLVGGFEPASSLSPHIKGRPARTTH